MEAGDKININQIIKAYKNIDGTPNFPSLFAIKRENRLPVLYEQNPARIASIVAAGLTMAMESMNLSRPMNAAQLMDLADTILDSSEEDNLSLEDLMLFLQKLTRGEYGKLYESMDIPKFMELFEIYREQRFQALRAIQHEQAIQYKALPVNNRLLTLRDLMTIKKDNP